MKILNIDAFAKTERSINFAGKTYAVEETSVQQFIDNLKAAESLAGAGDQETLVKSFEQAVVAISQAIPSMPLELVKGLKLAAVTEVLRFIRGELDAVATPEVQDGVEKKQD